MMSVFVHRQELDHQHVDVDVQQRCNPDNVIPFFQEIQQFFIIDQDVCSKLICF